MMAGVDYEFEWDDVKAEANTSKQWRGIHGGNDGVCRSAGNDPL
jgi:hypothetical protein